MCPRGGNDAVLTLESASRWNGPVMRLKGHFFSWAKYSGLTWVFVSREKIDSELYTSSLLCHVENRRSKRVELDVVVWRLVMQLKLTRTTMRRTNGRRMTMKRQMEVDRHIRSIYGRSLPYEHILTRRKRTVGKQKLWRLISMLRVGQRIRGGRLPRAAKFKEDRTVQL